MSNLLGNYFDENTVSLFEIVINKTLKKKYEWFDHIDVNKLSFSKSQNYMGLDAVIYADEDWVGEQWREFYYSKPIPSGTEDDPIILGEIIGDKFSIQLQNDFKQVFSFVTSYKKPKYMSHSWIVVKPIEMNKKKVTEQISRIKGIMGLITENDENYTLYNKDTYKISFPKTPTDEGALFIFGGLGMGGRSYVYDKVPEYLKNKRIVISTNHNQTLENVIQQIKEDFENNEKTPTDFKIKSVCGFSGGGPSTLKQLGKGYFIGLMDPHIDAQGIFLLEKNVPNLQPLNDIRLLFSLDFWKGYETNSEEIRVYKDTGKHHPENPYFNLVKATEILGKSAVEIQASHSQFVNKFFDLFHNLV